VAVTLKAMAIRFGREHASSRVSWVTQELPGGGRYTRNDKEGAKHLLRLLEEGNGPEDIYPRSLFSGEWADDPTPSTFAEDLGIDSDHPRLDDLLNVAEDSYDREWWTQIYDQILWAAKGS